MAKIMTMEEAQPSEDEKILLEEHGLVRIPMDTPFSVPPVNSILVLGDRPSLIDAGMCYGDNFEHLKEVLSNYGYDIKDLAEVFLTHPHVDHIGLAGKLIQSSSVKICTWEKGVHRYEQYMEFWHKDRASFLELLSRSDVKRILTDKIKKTPSHLDGVVERIKKVDRPFKSEEPLEMVGGRQVYPLHVPGHTPWCIAYWFPDTGVLVSGDALLEYITANPLIYPDDAAPAGWQGIEVFRYSLERLLDLPIKLVVPGHGRAFSGYEMTIRRALRQQLRRQERFLRRLETPLTAYELAVLSFGEEIVENSLFLVMSEVTRHMEWLASKGMVEIEKGTLWRYKNAS